MVKTNKTERRFNLAIIVLSICIPLIVAVLFGVNLRQLGFEVQPLVVLPPIYATVNAITVILLLAALVAIKNQQLIWHRRFILLAMLCSVSFLLMYVLYHMTAESTPYGGQGWWRYLYFFVLISHIVLSIVVIPLVLLAFAKGWLNKVAQHKKLVHFALPLWLYVAASGVVVYLMISPYYG